MNINNCCCHLTCLYLWIALLLLRHFLPFCTQTWLLIPQSYSPQFQTVPLCSLIVTCSTVVALLKAGYSIPVLATVYPCLNLPHVRAYPIMPLLKRPGSWKGSSPATSKVSQSNPQLLCNCCPTVVQLLLPTKIIAHGAGSWRVQAESMPSMVTVFQHNRMSAIPNLARLDGPYTPLVKIRVYPGTSSHITAAKPTLCVGGTAA
jgi:hypothetical protein